MPTTAIISPTTMNESERMTDVYSLIFSFEVIQRRLTSKNQFFPLDAFTMKCEDSSALFFDES
jgi:hypothetical protein